MTISLFDGGNLNISKSLNIGQYVQEEKSIMECKPFLANFAIKRKDDHISEFSSYYDEDLELNVLRKKNSIFVPPEQSNEFLSTMTKTFVESEKPDSDRELGELFPDKTDHQIFLATQTITEVANERPDRDAHDDHLILLSTQTFTKTITEKSDSDN
jgi:hypothetical protein